MSADSSSGRSAAQQSIRSSGPRQTGRPCQTDTIQIGRKKCDFQNDSSVLLAGPPPPALFSLESLPVLSFFAAKTFNRPNEQEEKSESVFSIELIGVR